MPTKRNKDGKIQAYGRDGELYWIWPAQLKTQTEPDGSPSWSLNAPGKTAETAPEQSSAAPGLSWSETAPDAAQVDPEVVPGGYYPKLPGAMMWSPRSGEMRQARDPTEQREMEGAGWQQAISPGQAFAARGLNALTLDAGSRFSPEWNAYSRQGEHDNPYASTAGDALASLALWRLLPGGATTKIPAPGVLRTVVKPGLKLTGQQAGVAAASAANRAPEGRRLEAAKNAALVAALTGAPLNFALAPLTVRTPTGVNATIENTPQFTPLHASSWPNPESWSQEAAAHRVSSTRMTPKAAANIAGEYMGGSLNPEQGIINFGKELNAARNPATGAPLFGPEKAGTLIARAEQAKNIHGAYIEAAEKVAEDAGSLPHTGAALDRARRAGVAALSAHPDKADVRTRAFNEVLDSFENRLQPYSPAEPPSVRAVTTKPTYPAPPQIDIPFPLRNLVAGPDVAWQLPPPQLLRTRGGGALIYREGEGATPFKLMLPDTAPATSRGRSIYRPGHPRADEQGFVAANQHGPLSGPELPGGQPVQQPRSIPLGAQGEPGRLKTDVLRPEEDSGWKPLLAPEQSAVPVQQSLAAQGSLFPEMPTQRPPPMPGMAQPPPDLPEPGPVTPAWTNIEYVPGKPESPPLAYTPFSDAKMLEKWLRDAADERGGWFSADVAPNRTKVGKQLGVSSAVIGDEVRGTVRKSVPNERYENYLRDQAAYRLLSRLTEAAEGTKGATGAPDSLSAILGRNVGAQTVAEMGGGIGPIIFGAQLGKMIGRQSGKAPSRAASLARLAEGAQTPLMSPVHPEGGYAVPLRWRLAGNAITGAQNLPGGVGTGAAESFGRDVGDMLSDSEPVTDPLRLRAEIVRRFFLGQEP